VEPRRHRLADCGLAVRDRDALDAHPLVREHFGSRIREQNPDAWQAARGRLFDHLTQSTEHRPDTLEGLQPLYQAIAHGCQAERQQEALYYVYIDRILRGTGGDGFYAAWKLGAIGADLGAVACFFDPPWSRVSPALTEADQGWLLNQAGHYLRTLGRLDEAVELLRSGVAMATDQKDWANAARGAGNLSEIGLTLGDVAGAVRDAEQSVDYADRSDHESFRIVTRTALADALHQAGREQEALVQFREAEVMQAELQPMTPRLYGMSGYWYWDLLLGGAERAARVGSKEREDAEACNEVERRATQSLRWSIDHRILFEIALAHLTLGRVRLYRAIIEGSAPDIAEDDIGQAVDGLRRAGRNDYLPSGLLTRGWLDASEGHPRDARAHLAEAEEIAERGPMPLYLADIQLYRARLFHDRIALAEARRLVEEHGYFRRREELEDLEAAAAHW
jgi:tetratricopeptide (TPR) repeat protein